MEIRYIIPTDDRMEISKLYEESWKCTYKGIIPQDYLDSISNGHWSSTLDNPNWKTLICIDNGRIVEQAVFVNPVLSNFVTGAKLFQYICYRIILVKAMEKLL